MMVPLVHHDDAVRRLDGGQTMRNQDAGGVFEDEIERLLECTPAGALQT